MSSSIQDQPATSTSGQSLNDDDPEVVYVASTPSTEEKETPKAAPKAGAMDARGKRKSGGDSLAKLWGGKKRKKKVRDQIVPGHLTIVPGCNFKSYRVYQDEFDCYIREVFMAEDGNCLFRSMSYTVYGNADHHAELRQAIATYILQNQAHFLPYFDHANGNYMQYCSNMMEDAVWGDHLEIMAFSKIYKVPVLIYDENHTQPQQGSEFDKGDGRKAHFFYRGIRVDGQSYGHYNVGIWGKQMTQPGNKVQHIPIGKTPWQSPTPARLDVDFSNEFVEKDVRQVMEFTGLPKKECEKLYRDNDQNVSRAVEASLK